jgi:CheY-like chemotaxis protein
VALSIGDEELIRQLQKMDAIGRLAGGVAHDFNNMLGAITLYCDLALEAGESKESILENIQCIKEVTQRGASLTQQLLIFSRKQLVQLQTVDLNTVVKNLNKMLTRVIGENIKIATRLSENLNHVKVDPSHIEQVITNLYVNARDAMPDGGTITVETANVHLGPEFISTHLAVEPGEYVLLSIADTGCGMDPQTRSKIFEPFFTTKPYGKGSGLGLTVVYGIVKQCKGTIGLHSEPGKGTVLKIYLPVSEEADRTAAAEAVNVSVTDNNQTILLVEDDERLRRGFSEILERKGFKVLVARDSDEAIQRSQNYDSEIHLLLTDIVMPGLNGFELSKKISAKRSGLRVLYMSGYADDTIENAEKKIDREIDFIQKPFNTAKLIAKINEVFGKGSHHFDD